MAYLTTLKCFHRAKILVEVFIEIPPQLKYFLIVVSVTFEDHVNIL